MPGGSMKNDNMDVRGAHKHACLFEAFRSQLLFGLVGSESQTSMMAGEKFKASAKTLFSHTRAH